MGDNNFKFNKFLLLNTSDLLTLKKEYKYKCVFIGTEKNDTKLLCNQIDRESIEIGLSDQYLNQFKKIEIIITDTFKNVIVIYMKKFNPNNEKNEINSEINERSSSLTDYLNESFDKQQLYSENSTDSDDEYEEMKNKYQQWKKRMDNN